MKDIKGFEGKYAITSCGKVWSYRLKDFLRPWDNGQGYLQVRLGKERKICRVHRLVAEAYIPNPENKPIVNHKDEIKSHNWINNLEWVTSKENNNFGTRTERQAKNYVRKPVKCIELNKIYCTVAEAARDLNINNQSISNCLHGKQITAGGYHWKYTEEKLK